MTEATPVLRLRQRRGLREREFLLVEDRVEVQERLPLAASEARVALVRIADEPVHIATRSRGLLGLAIAATLVGTAVASLVPRWADGPALVALVALAALVAAGVLAGGLWIAFWRTWRRQLVYPAAEVDLTFFADASHRADLDPFLEALFERRRQVLGTASGEGGPSDDLERWSWLHEQGYLTDEEVGLLEERLGQGAAEPGDTVH